MSNSPYSKYAADELILRDYLAADRTILANERTLLAYIRTGLAFVAAGVYFMHFFDVAWINAVGLLFIPIGFVTLFFGAWRFLQTKVLLNGINREGLNRSQDSYATGR